MIFGKSGNNRGARAICRFHDYFRDCTPLHISTLGVRPTSHTRILGQGASFPTSEADRRTMPISVHFRFSRMNTPADSVRCLVWPNGCFTRSPCTSLSHATHGAWSSPQNPPTVPRPIRVVARGAPPGAWSQPLPNLAWKKGAQQRTQQKKQDLPSLSPE